MNSTSKVPYVFGLFLLLLLSAGFAACSGGTTTKSQLTPDEFVKKYGTPMPVRATMTAKRSKGGSVNFEFQYQVPRDTSLAAFNILFNASDCYVTMTDKNLGLLDTVDVHLAVGTTSDNTENDSVIVSSTGYWLNPTSREFSEVTFDLVTLSRKKLYHDVFVFDLSPKSEKEVSSPLMQLIPDIDERSDSTIVFGLAAKRVRGEYADYFPSSERVHLEIVSQKGEVLYNSALGVNFLQEVSPVDPLKKGAIIRYSFTWGGKASNGKPLPSGKYIARLSLASKPEAYTTTLPFEWKSDK